MNTERTRYWCFEKAGKDGLLSRSAWEEKGRSIPREAEAKATWKYFRGGYPVQLFSEDQTVPLGQKHYLIPGPDYSKIPPDFSPIAGEIKASQLDLL
jgi:hypothetical protein